MGFFVLGCAAAPIMPRSPAHRQIPAKVPPRTPGLRQSRTIAANAPPCSPAAPRSSGRHPATKSRPKFRRARRSTLKTPRRPTKHNKKKIYIYEKPPGGKPGGISKAETPKSYLVNIQRLSFSFSLAPSVLHKRTAKSRAAALSYPHTMRAALVWFQR